MKSLYILLFMSLAILACKSKSSSDAKAAEDAITRVKEHPGDSAYFALDTVLNQYIEMKGYSDSTTARLLVDAARALNGANQPAHAMRYYNRYMAHYPGRSDQADKLIDSTLKYIGSNMFNDSSFRLNEPMAMLYIEACELAAAADPALPNAPEHLHRAAETARTIRDIPRAIELYNWIIDAHPQHPRAATSMFLRAFTYDNDLKQFDKAGKYYNDFLTKYPNNEFAESAKFLLEHLGKSEEELKKILEKKGEEVQ
jgi:tetratricopeptide (TPR) repeat protein